MLYFNNKICFAMASQGKEFPKDIKPWTYYRDKINKISDDMSDKSNEEITEHILDLYKKRLG